VAKAIAYFIHNSLYLPLKKRECFSPVPPLYKRRAGGVINK